MVTGTQDPPRGGYLLDHHRMEERARLKALEALFDPTTTARIVALPAAGEVVIAIEASPVSQYDLMRSRETMATAATCPPIWAQKESAA